MSEKDPNGLDAHAPGAKLDNGKVPVFQGLIQQFPNACMQVARHSSIGAKKYSWGGWRSVDDGITRYSDAMTRHLLQEQEESHDEDTGSLHAVSVAWNAMARLELMLTEEIAKTDQAFLAYTNARESVFVSKHFQTTDDEDWRAPNDPTCSSCE